MDKKPFKFWVPIDKFEKAKNDTGQEIMKIKGVASTTAKDSDNEVLDPSGFDLSFFKNQGFINWNHQAKKDPSAYIGEPTKAEINKNNELYIEGELWPESKLAKGVYSLAKILEKKRESNPNYKRSLGYSVEGHKVEEEGENVSKAFITHVAVTPTPKNPGTWLGILKGETFDDDYEFEGDEEVLEKANANGGKISYIIDVTNANGDRVTVDKELNIRINKALVTSSSSGRAIMKEDLEKKLKFPKEVAKAIITITKGYENGLINKEYFEKIKSILKERFKKV